MNAAAKDVLSSEKIEEEMRGLPDWRYRDGGLHTAYVLPSARAALNLVAAIGDIAEEQNHHPDLDWRYNRVILTLSSHDAGGAVTGRDVVAAAAISEAAAGTDAKAEP